MTAPTKEELDRLVRLCHLEAPGKVKGLDEVLLGCADAITALRQRIAQLESVPTSEEASAAASRLDDLGSHLSPHQNAAWAYGGASLLRALSRQVEAKDEQLDVLARGNTFLKQDAQDQWARATNAEAALAEANRRNAPREPFAWYWKEGHMSPDTPNGPAEYDEFDEFLLAEECENKELPAHAIPLYAAPPHSDDARDAARLDALQAIDRMDAEVSRFGKLRGYDKSEATDAYRVALMNMRGAIMHERDNLTRKWGLPIDAHKDAAMGGR